MSMLKYPTELSLKFILSLNLHPYFVYACSLDETLQMCMPLLSSGICNRCQNSLMALSIYVNDANISVRKSGWCMMIFMHVYDGHFRKMLRYNKFGANNINLATTIKISEI